MESVDVLPPVESVDVLSPGTTPPLFVPAPPPLTMMREKIGEKRVVMPDSLRKELKKQLNELWTGGTKVLYIPTKKIGELMRALVASGFPRAREQISARALTDEWRKVRLEKQSLSIQTRSGLVVKPTLKRGRPPAKITKTPTPPKNKIAADIALDDLFSSMREKKHKEMELHKDYVNQLRAAACDVPLTTEEKSKHEAAFHAARAVAETSTRKSDVADAFASAHRLARELPTESWAKDFLTHASVQAVSELPTLGANLVGGVGGDGEEDEVSSQVDPVSTQDFKDSRVKHLRRITDWNRQGLELVASIGAEMHALNKLEHARGVPYTHACAAWSHLNKTHEYSCKASNEVVLANVKAAQPNLE